MGVTNLHGERGVLFCTVGGGGRVALCWVLLGRGGCGEVRRVGKLGKVGR